MTGFAQHYDAAVERALASDARAEASDARAAESDARAEGFRTSCCEFAANLVAARFGAEAGERLKTALDGIVDLDEFQKATVCVNASRTVEELFAYFDERR